jgi:hypothetical protein
MQPVRMKSSPRHAGAIFQQGVVRCHDILLLCTKYGRTQWA